MRHLLCSATGDMVKVVYTKCNHKLLGFLINANFVQNGSKMLSDILNFDNFENF